MHRGCFQVCTHSHIHTFPFVPPPPCCCRVASNRKKSWGHSKHVFPSKGQTQDFTGEAKRLLRGELVYQLLLRKLKKKKKWQGTKRRRLRGERKSKGGGRLGAANTKAAARTQSWLHGLVHKLQTPHPRNTPDHTNQMSYQVLYFEPWTTNSPDTC